MSVGRTGKCCQRPQERVSAGGRNSILHSDLNGWEKQELFPQPEEGLTVRSGGNFGFVDKNSVVISESG